jgi:hypothetical protein
MGMKHVSLLRWALWWLLLLAAAVASATLLTSSAWRLAYWNAANFMFGLQQTSLPR